MRACQRCPARFTSRAEHCPQCGNCDYIEVSNQVEIEGMPKVSKRAGRGRVKAVA